MYRYSLYINIPTVDTSEYETKTGDRNPRTTRKAKTVLRMRTGSDVKSRFNSLSVARQPSPNPNIFRLSL